MVSNKRNDKKKHRSIIVFGHITFFEFLNFLGYGVWVAVEYPLPKLLISKLLIKGQFKLELKVRVVPLNFIAHCINDSDG